MVPSESFTTLATSFTDLLKLCSLAETSRAEDKEALCMYMYMYMYYMYEY